MFKRANKITSLLVAAAAVVSIVPASAADVKKVDSQDGVVYNAVAYKGADLVDGEVKDNDGAYYLKDGKYTDLADVDSGSDYAVYGTKYVDIEDGDNFLDLSTGKVTDDSIAEDAQDDAASALRKKIKDSDRYKDTITTTNTTVFGDNDIADLAVIPGNKFSEIWYAAKIGAEDVTESGLTTPTAYFNVYTDDKGNYIDADYNLGKIKVETTNGSATIENSIDTEDLYVNDKTTVTQTGAKVVFSKELGQDKDYIYRYAELNISVTGATGTVKINNKAIDVSELATLPVIQKISKAQDSDDIDDAKYSKTVYNYIISDDSANLTSDSVVAAQTFAKTTATKAAVIGGKLVLSYVDEASAAEKNVEVLAMSLKGTNGYYYTDLEDKTTGDAEYDTNLNRVAFDTDVDGNIYIIDAGYVKKFDGTDDWTKVYKVDGSMNAISTYDKDNMVVWSQDDEVYSVIGGKDATEVETPVTTTPAVKAGWAQAADKTWSFVKADGTKATGWFQDATGTWYFAKAEGTMVANGWAQSGSAWYYLGASGAMATNAWVQSGADWYYVGATGAMLTNTTVGGYTLGASGAWVK